MTPNSPSTVGYVVAALIAAALSLVELPSFWGLGRRSRPAVAWLLLRCSLNALTGFLGYRFGFLAFGRLDWFVEPVPMLIGGVAGPALFRSQFALLGTGQENLKYGVANMYAKLQGKLDAKIHLLLAEAETNWLLDEVIPACRNHWKVKNIVERAIVIIEQRKNLSEPQRKSKIKYLRERVLDPALKEDQQYKLAFQFIVLEAGRKAVTRFKQPP